MSISFSHNLAEIARNGGFNLIDDYTDGQDTNVDWRILASIDIYDIIKGSTYEKLDEIIPFLIKTSLKNLLNARVLDPAIGKVFTLSQLSLQYLLFCTKFLDKSVTTLRDNIYASQKENSELQKALKKREKELDTALGKLKKRDEVFSCSKCSKNFESQCLLDSHISRKHQEKKSDENLINAVKLEIENKELKTKLNLAEKELMEKKAAIVCQKCIDDEKRVFKNVGIQINYEEKEKDDTEKEDWTQKLKEIDEVIRTMMAEQSEQFEKYKIEEEMRHTQEMSSLKEALAQMIETVKQNEVVQPPLPAPRHSVGIQASDESTENSEVMPVKPAMPVMNVALKHQEESLWKVRFDELEKMYLSNQAQMAQSMKDLERAYTEKIKKLEEQYIQQSDVSLMPPPSGTSSTPFFRPKPLAPPKLFQPRLVQKELVPNVVVRNQKREVISTSEEDEISEHHIQVKPPVPMQAVESQKPLRREEKPSKIPVMQNLPTSNIISIRDKEDVKKKKIFSGQKWFKRKNDARKNAKLLEVMKNNDAFLERVKAEEMVAARMNIYKIDKDTKRLHSKKINEIQTELANQREFQKKTHSHFFINRNKIKARVDELFKRYTKSSSEQKSKQKVITKENVKAALTKGREELEKQKKKTKKKVLFDLEDSDFDVTSLESDVK